MASTRRSDLISVLAVALLIYLCWVLRSVVLLIYVSIIFAVIFAPAVEAIQRVHIRSWHPSRGAAILILLAIVLAAISLFLVLAVPPIVSDAQGLRTDLPHTLQQLQDKLRHLPLGDRIASRLQPGALGNYLTEIFANTLKVFKSLAGGITALLTLVLMTAYFILDGRKSFGWFVCLFPVHQRGRLRDTLNSARQRMQRWLGGQVTLMLILGCSSAVVFGILGIRYFYALAVFAGIANFVPILGPIATVIVASAVAALDSWTKVLGVIIFYLVYQQVENSYLTPRIMKSSVGLPAVAVVVALAVGGELAGILGAIVAVPTAALIATVINEYVSKRVEPGLSEDRPIPTRRAS
jgi:predicted PurR-regulated permease PerM